jgi:hypothetical protein
MIGTTAAIIAGSVIAGGATVAASKSASNASKNASQAQQQSNDKAIAEQQRQFNETRALLQPYVDAGSPALKEQMRILGLLGTDEQRVAIAGQEQSPFFQSLVKRGEDAILQNASATGGLRGGNVQAALSQFRPELLNQFINQQYTRLGGIATLGQNAAAGVGNLGQATANNIGNLLTSSGAAQAGGILAQGQANQSLISGLGQIGGTAIGALAQQGVFGGGGFGGNAAYNAALANTQLVTPRGF